MSRKQPAIFNARDAIGRKWTIRVGPLGIEAVTHQARAVVGGSGRVMRYGQQRHSIAWSDLLPPSVEVFDE